MTTKTPFFIVGFPRSGTTLLASLFDRQSNVIVPPETHFFNKFMFPSKGKDILKNHEVFLKSCLKLTRIKDLKIDEHKLLEKFTQYSIDYKSLFMSIIQTYLEENIDCHIMEKTPTHLLFTEEIINMFPETKIICIVRDGRDCALSLMNVPWTHKNIYRHAADWNYQTLLAIKYQSIYPNNFKIVKYEELIQRPEETLTKLFDFIGLKYLDSFKENKNNNVVPEWELDWKKQSTGKIDSSKISVWKKNIDKLLIWNISKIMQESLSKMKYDVDNLEKTDHISIRQRIKLLVYSKWVFKVFHKIKMMYRKYKPNIGYAHRIKTIEK